MSAERPEQARVVFPMTMRETVAIRSELISGLVGIIGEASSRTSQAEDEALATDLADYLISSGWVIDRPQEEADQ